MLLFRRAPRLEHSLAEARTLLAELPAAPAPEAGAAAPRKRPAAARERAARQRVERLEAALAELPGVQAAKPAAEQDKARVSRTDPPARVWEATGYGTRQRGSGRPVSFARWLNTERIDQFSAPSR